MVLRRVPPALGATLLFLVVFGVLFAPVLAGRATIVHGDALSVSLPLQQVLSASLANGSLPLWSDRIYGGHPLFAEGQGGFAHPLNWLLFGVLPRLFRASDALVGAGTLYAHGLLHVLCGLIAALGTFVLCRALSLGAVVSAVSALALACSQDWLGLTSNAAIALSTAFAPLALFAVERWWRKPDVVRALVVALATTAMLLGGYPQAVHAVAIFAAVMLLVRTDAAWWRSPWRHLATGGLAVLVTVGLSAVQLLPTLELVGESVRAEGTSVLAAAGAEPKLRGLLFSIAKRAVVEPGLGSIVVLALAGIGLRRNRTVAAYALASFLLLQLSMAEQSFLYRALDGVLPGLDRFRVTHLYATIGLVGAAVLAGFGVQRLAEQGGDARSLLAQGVIVGVAILGACWVVEGPDAPGLGYAFPLVAVALVAGLLAWRRERLVPVALLGVLLVEIAALRLPLHDFVDVDIVSKPPPTVAELLSRGAPERGSRVANVPRFESYLVGYATAVEPGLPRLVGIFLASMDGGSNLIWGIAPVNGNLALPLARRMAVSDVLAEEVRGERPRPAGSRLMDAIGLRYVVARNKHRDREPYADDLREIFRDDDFHFFVLENENAHPRLSLVAQREAHWVPSLDLAIASFGPGEDVSALILEGRAPQGVATRRSAGPSSLVLEERVLEERVFEEMVVLESRAEAYRVTVEAAEPVYLVVADAPYHGWKAQVDGEPSPVIAANILAKAVAIPEGTHRVRVFFEPDSFYRGARISIVTFAAVVLFFVWKRVARR